MTATSTDIDAIGRITEPTEAERLGIDVYRALLADLRALTPADWDTATICAPWTVSDLVRHLLGAAKANASTREMLRQQIYGARHKSEFGGNALDATNELQVADHRDLSPVQLIVELEHVFEKSVRTRTHRSRVYDRINVPIDAGGSTADGMPARLNLAELFRVVYTRDVWLHRIDIARALGREAAMQAAVDGRLAADIVKEWADRHGKPFELHLTGAAGGHYRRGGDGPIISLDTADFCWILSGRGNADGLPGAHLLSQRVLF
jgi:uncharacterized protein (TIGR03083 family)